jgi:hypothetical protein
MCIAEMYELEFIKIGLEEPGFAKQGTPMMCE